jgi:hypothetical protein
MLNDVRFRVYMSIKSHLWTMFDDGVLSLSSLEILIEACDKSVNDYKNKSIFWQFIENSLPSLDYLNFLNRVSRYLGNFSRNHLTGRLTQIFEVRDRTYLRL